MQPTRLFDIMEQQAQEHPLPDALAAKIKGSWRLYSSQEVVDTARELALGLLGRHKLAHGDRVGLISLNRPEWIFTDLALLQLGAVSVPIYPTATAKDYEYILGHSEATVVFVSTRSIYDKIVSIKDNLPNLKAVYSFDELEGVTHWSEVLEQGRRSAPATVAALSERRNQVTPDDLASIIYTSGTTGTPKGVMLTHHNMLSNLTAVKNVIDVSIVKRALSFLPLSHVLERLGIYMYQSSGIAIYFAESIDSIARNLVEVKPQGFITVPRLLEKIYESIVAKGQELTGAKRALFDWALHLGLSHDPDKPAGPVASVELSLARKLVFSKWIEALGGNLKLVIVGGSALQPRLARVFWAAGIRAIEGYGLTETSPVIAFNNLTEHRIGTVGKVIPNMQVRIAQEEGYRTGEGEILTKGPSLMKGYYRNPEATSEAIDSEGWFHTGDIGMLEAGGFLRITDRKKEMFKTSGGKYIAPLAIENKLRECPYIAQAIVVGENQKFPAGIIVPEFSVLTPWCAAIGIKATEPAELIERPEVIDLFKQEIDRINANFGQWERLKQFRLVADEWSITSGELTPKLSLRRRVIVAKYKEQIDAIYGAQLAPS
jgi:long-chain acyl-CoA synthetase